MLKICAPDFLYLVLFGTKILVYGGGYLQGGSHSEIVIKSHTKTDTIEDEGNQPKNLQSLNFRKENRQFTHSKFTLGQFVRQKSAFKVVFTKKLQIKGPK